MSQPAKPYPEKKHLSSGYAPPPPRFWLSCLLVLGGIGAITLLICGGALWYFTDSITQGIHDSINISLKHLGTDIVGAVYKHLVEGSELPAEDKQEVIAQLDRVSNGVKQNLITSGEQSKIMEGLAKSPLFFAMVNYGVTYEFRKRPGLDQEEQRQAERTVQRVARGSAEGKVKYEQLQTLLSAFFQNAHPPPPAQTQQPFSDEDVRKLLNDLQKLADEQGVPDEPYELKVGKEVKRIVDEVLAEKL